MVLVKVGQSIVHVDRSGEGGGNIKREGACLGPVVEGPALDIGREGCPVNVTVCVVQHDFLHLLRRHEQSNAERQEQKTHDKERRQNRLWCEDGLPRLETLLFERRH